MNIAIFGSINHDHVMLMDRIARPGETRMARGLESFFGGKGANQAVASARAAGPDIDVLMLGAVGNDGSGQAAAENLRANGVITDHLLITPSPTGTAHIQVSQDGENAIAVFAGANAALTANAVPAALLAGIDHLVCQGEIAFAEVLEIARHYKADRSSGHLTVNLAPVPLDETPARIEALLQCTDLLVVNAIEAAQVADKLEIARPGAIGDLADILSARIDADIVITRGAEGAIATRPGERPVFAPAFPVDPVDTTGAGDTFVGVLVAGLAEGLTFEKALRRATRAGALACLRKGAQTAMPTRKELEREDG